MKLSKHKRWNASRKAEVALALLKGASLEEVSRMTGKLTRGGRVLNRSGAR